ncbi:MAG: methyltransferase domain-containing protein [Anaerolineaceae bacterium]|nr:methyltransferase domain-containing protein [Anaerolineae bacterium]MCB9078992.1 methyltransferase domain-containing protein [Anaerolineaceae bacterium]
MSTNGINQEKAEAFAEKMVGVLNQGALALMCSIGHRTKLFDTLAILPPATSAQIAEATSLNERYVREWLNGMVVSQVINYDPPLKTYHLPPEHAATLTRKAGADNLALYTQHIGGLGSVEDKIVDCFANGGGVPYADFPRFHEVMAEDSNVNVVEPLIEQILPLMPGLIEKLQQGITVLDVGCGRGNALKHLAQTYPNSRFFGFDFSEEAIAVAQADVQKLGLTHLRFEVKDATTFNESNQYDLIFTFDAIHDQAQPGRVLHNIARALKPDGVYFMQDIAGSSHVHHNVDHPLAPFLYTISTMHCMTVSLAEGGEGLGTMWGKEKALEMLADAGFTNVQVEQPEHDPMNYFYICRQ